MRSASVRPTTPHCSLPSRSAAAHTLCVWRTDAIVDEHDFGGGTCDWRICEEEFRRRSLLAADGREPRVHRCRGDLRRHREAKQAQQEEKDEGYVLRTTHTRSHPAVAE